MLYALIDVGSNSIRLCIFKYEKGKITSLINRKEMAGLAGYVSDGELSKRGIAKAVVVLNEFRGILKNFGIKNIHVFATASLRNISNTEYVLKRISEETGMTVEIISGEEEARLDFIGIRYFSAVDEGLISDIGGASTEIVIFEKNSILEMVSLPVGSLNLYVKNVIGLFPEKDEIKSIKKQVKKRMDVIDFDEYESLNMLHAIGGTARAVFRICRELFYDNAQVTVITAKDIKKLMRIIEKADTEKLKKILRIVPERVFTIVPGIIVLNEIVKRSGVINIQLSSSGVREGYLVDRVLKLFHD